MSLHTIELTDIAHGGECIGRLEGRVVFVRGGIPGETVRVEITDATKKSLWRARVVDVLEAAPTRVIEPCPIAARCGGCDFQHVEVAHQRSLKAKVVADQLARLGGYAWSGEVEEVPGGPFGWRTRMRYHQGEVGPGMRAARSHEVVALPSQGCLLAHPAGGVPASGRGDLHVCVASSGVAINARPPVVTQRVRDREFRVAADGFWQVHPNAPEVLVSAVLEALGDIAGARALDLYCGVGLFAGFLVDQRASVVGVEGNRAAVKHARCNVPEARFFAGDVARTLAARDLAADVVVLDPPRAGAGRAVVEAIAARQPRTVSYVACDPASLGRDLGYFARSGYRVGEVRAFDLFPMTHHVECVATLHLR